MTETGFYSSPHLVSATERIRINGKPLTQEKFAKHFWEVYDKVVRNQDDKPAYFKFLTILAFNVFIKEDVDVAVIEVGIGGKYVHYYLTRPSRIIIVKRAWHQNKWIDSL